MPFDVLDYNGRWPWSTAMNLRTLESKHFRAALVIWATGGIGLIFVTCD